MDLWEGLDGDALLLVASYLTPAIPTSSNNDGASMTDSGEEDSDEDSDDDEGNDSSYEYDMSDPVENDMYYERQYEKYGERMMKQQRAAVRFGERQRRADEMERKRCRLKREANSPIAMAGSCSSWRRALTGGDSRADEKIWKNVAGAHVPELFRGEGEYSRPMTCPSGRRCESAPRSPPVRDGRPISPDDLRRTIGDGRRDVRDGVFAVVFECSGTFREARFIAMARIGGGDEDGVLAWDAPEFSTLVDRENARWWKAEREHRRSRGGESGVFPSVEIFYTIPSTKKTVKIHRGSPQWESVESSCLEDYWDAEGSDDGFVGTLGSRLGFALLLDGDQVSVVFETGCYGHYTYASKEYDEEYDDKSEKELRLRDIEDNLLLRRNCQQEGTKRKRAIGEI